MGEYDDIINLPHYENEALYEPNYDDSEKHTLFDSID